MSKAIEPIRVLIADDDGQMARRLADFLAEKGFETQFAMNGKEAKELILAWRPRFIFADLMLSQMNALDILDYIKNEHVLRHQFMDVIVMSGHTLESNVRQALNRGARDYLAKPFKFDILLQRLIFHCRSYRQVRELEGKDYKKVDEASLMLHLTDLVLRQAISPSSLEDTLFNLTQMLSMKVDGVRCSIVNCLDHRTGVVVTSNDNRKATGIQLDLTKYPEINHVMNTNSLLAIENLDENAEMKALRGKVKEISFNSMVVCPVLRHGKQFGVLSLRLPPEKQTISDNEIRFVEIVSHVVSLVLSNEIHKDSGDFWRDSGVSSPLPFPLKAVKNE